MDLAEHITRMFSDSVLESLIESEQITTSELMLYGLVNIPITNNRTGDTVAYVTYWGDVVTACTVSDDQCDLTWIEQVSGPFDREEALQIYLWTLPRPELNAISFVEETVKLSVKKASSQSTIEPTS